MIVLAVLKAHALVKNLAFATAIERAASEQRAIS